MYSYKIIILFILAIGLASCHEIYTKTQLRGLHQHHMNKILSEEIQRIVERVLAYAQINHTSYSHVYNTDHNVMDESAKILLSFSDEKILTRLQMILIDAIITISEKCCNPKSNNICKFIVINW
jgi:hypothetical protein